jgi:choline dehydrogenase
VALRSADPLEPPEIVFNYFDTGVGNYAADLQAMYEGLKLGREAFDRQVVPLTEVLPGRRLASQEDLETYIKDTAWGHYALCTCPIGRDNDPMAVLDSKFCVRGVHRLRVVDGSVCAGIAGAYPITISTYMVAEKAADVILSEIATR